MSSHHHSLRRWLLVLGFSLLAAACQPSEASGSPDNDLDVVRLGYFPNVTHAPAIIGVSQGFFQEQLGDVVLETSTFNAGTEAVEALFSDATDMSFIGPNPAINAFSQSAGEAVRIIAGTTSGGAALVVAPDIGSVEDLEGTRISSPSLGNTQDVALRAWLTDQGFETTLEGAGDVSVVPQGNAQTLETFQAGEIDGAWVPEPWATRLVLEGGGHVLVDEREIWPDGQFVTTHLMVSTTFLDEHPDVVTAILSGLIEAQEFVTTRPGEAQTAVNETIEAITGKALAPEVITAAWSNLTFTLDPIGESLRKSAADAVEVGLLDPVDLDGIYDLELLNTLLRERDEPEVTP